MTTHNTLLILRSLITTMYQNMPVCATNLPPSLEKSTKAIVNGVTMIQRLNRAIEVGYTDTNNKWRGTYNAIGALEHGSLIAGDWTSFHQENRE